MKKTLFIIFMVLPSISFSATPLKCSDQFAKDAVRESARASRQAHVDMLNRQGRGVTLSVGEVSDIMTLDRNVSVGIVKCAAKVAVSSNFKPLSIPVKVDYILGRYEETEEPYIKFSKK